MQVKRLRIAAGARRRPAGVQRAGVLPPVAGPLPRERNHRIEKNESLCGNPLAEQDCCERTDRLCGDDEIVASSSGSDREVDLGDQTGVTVLGRKIEGDGFVTDFS